MSINNVSLFLSKGFSYKYEIGLYNWDMLFFNSLAFSINNVFSSIVL